jgi:5-methyltetrahydropteroyltriglutamate--homocysteine methyltransferase
MVQTCDVGSMPFTGDFDAFSKGAKPVDPLMELLYIEKHSVEKRFFEEKIVQSLIDKVRVGIDVPNYPQFRDMSEMFLSLIGGIAKAKNGYQVTGPLSVKEGKPSIPEVQVLRERVKEVYENARKPLRVRVCVTGPYTLSSAFIRKEPALFRGLGEVISQVVEENCFRGKFGGVALVAVDEPVFGLVDDPLLDFGSSGAEALLKAWESIFHKAKSKGVQTCIHLHSTSNELFWQVKPLDIVESHVGDPLYSSSRTGSLLEREDKFLKASISITDFDVLIRNRIEASVGRVDEATMNQKVADSWAGIGKGRIDPTIFLESLETVETRLWKIINQYGVERVPYAGPECGLRSFPTYNSAMKCLKRAAEAASNVNNRLREV